MSTPYTVVRGDTLTKIANRHGFRNWRAIYDHPAMSQYHLAHVAQGQGATCGYHLMVFRR